MRSFIVAVAGLMLFTTSEERWTNQRDELVRVYRLSLIRYK